MKKSSRPEAGATALMAAVIVAGVLGASALLGRRNAPEPGHPSVDRWYRGLRKPAYTPPQSVFGLVWPVLETGMAVGGYRLLRQAPSPERSVAVSLWLGTSAMIGVWTELFFRRHALGPSTAAAAAMTCAGVAFVATAARVDRPAALAGVPLTAWLGFATVLAEGVWRRNRRAAQ